MKAFVITPYKDAFQEIYEGTLRPAIEQSGLVSVIAKDEWFTGPIAEKILELIKESTVCIADLTETNPNVIYEVALAHSFNKPAILITQGETDAIPFDIRHHRVIRYTPTKEGLERLFHTLIQTLRDTLEFGESPTSLLKQMIVPSSLGNREGPYVVAASPLSYREAFRSRGGWKDRPLGTYADHVGIRGIMQSFGLIFGLGRLPELLDPDDFADEALYAPCHLYSIASPKANNLTGLIMRQFFQNRQPKWDFRADPKSADLRNPRLLLTVNDKPYEPVNRVDDKPLIWDFGIVIRGPHPSDPTYMFMVLAGRSSRGTEASCLAATDPDCLQKLKKRLEEEKIDLDNHKHAFCAVVSICAKNKVSNLGPDEKTFRVEDLSVYK